MAIVRYTSEELKKVKSMTDWNRVRNLKDEDIDFSDSPDVSQLLANGMIRKVKRHRNKEDTESLTLNVPVGIIAKLRSTGKDWQKKLSKKITYMVTKGLL